MVETLDNEGGNDIADEGFPTPCNHEGRTEEMHSCPFAEEIWDDDSNNCNCCDECTYECTMDI